MAEFSARDRAAGQWILATLFALGAIAAALRSWRLVDAEGITIKSVIWMLAFVGFLVLTLRYARGARVSTRDRSPPGA